jgi:nitrate/TMAO reductase-like tetraheme cytochrome c subunit
MKKSMYFTLFSMLLASSAMADSTRYTANNPTWKAECGSCHLAYPPQLLPATYWRAIMIGLDKHFGSDASLDAKVAAEVGAFLEKNSGRERAPYGKPDLRITKSRWFIHEHDEIARSVWISQKVKSASNCSACHQGAEKGDFSEHTVRIPK